MKPGPMPGILCTPGWPPDRTGESAGSVAIIFRFGFFSFKYFPVPVMVPPVPVVQTSTSIFPSVSFQISSAVALWAFGLSGFSNCIGMK